MNMKTRTSIPCSRPAAVILLAAASLPVLGQQWEVGAMGGGGFYLNNTVQAARGSADVGFKPGYSAGGWLGHNATGRFGGEIRYLFERNDMKLSSGGNQFSFGSNSHTVHYDLLIYTNSREDRIRPYFAIGGGIKQYVGTGVERAFQPLGEFAILTRTNQWRPVVSAGAGVKVAFGSRATFRVEFRDYATPFPKDVILPTPGSKISGWVHNFMPLFGLSYVFF
jgi:hypothetical protein